MKITHGELVTLNPWVRRITAPNPGPLTGEGTNTYIIGRQHVAVIDPGPIEQGHAELIYQLLTAQGCTITHIIMTHTHPDHSPAGRRLAELSGAPQIGKAADDQQFQDELFVADEELFDGWQLRTEEFELQAIFTPGHVSNHYCLLEKNSGLLLAGDHLMNGSTVVIVPPSGDMYDYIASLEKLRQYPIAAIGPAHGEVVAEPWAMIDAVIAHRMGREQKVVQALAGAGEQSMAQLVAAVYDDVPEAMHGMAIFSLEAHLLKLKRERRIEQRGDCWWMAKVTG
ncbi:glyoxylase-like metal-dependent hydrolase (beta-lactamase superfamily II) [Sinobacterium caligoides]|uniref:Glyoxylase-like metal-dependent hydrolase (Beta-lactamase superfamily II) n=1 Tax=Sinobacterium caligoides TaxID=933926 RepID=A0A3N2E131_9GAMM|nr:MBL fold metallo-hydrolase [Sinobacterium caligoides]ROS05622.1 glyoxylase-like metal-dependent hydrolase (beta-lactamase superfamily II) [Sinobacterium caligoides]